MILKSTKVLFWIYLVTFIVDLNEKKLSRKQRQKEYEKMRRYHKNLHG